MHLLCITRTCSIHALFIDYSIWLNSMNQKVALSKSYLNYLNNTEVVEIKSLLPHEDINSKRLIRTLKAIKSEEGLMKPIIIDSKKGIVIDGHHRLKALMLLGVKYVPVLVADYYKDIVDINSWMYIKSKRKISYRDIILLVESIEALSKRGSNHVIVKLGESTYEIKVDSIDFYFVLKNYINSINKLGLTKRPTNTALCLANDICIAMPKLSVNDIYKLVSKNDVLPPRTTYHITPLKYVKIFYPLKALSGV